MQGIVREYNVHADPNAPSGTDASTHGIVMTTEELRAELERREQCLQDTQRRSTFATDQWRVYTEVIEALQSKTKLLRMFIQASAGTVKSFLLETLYLWCLVRGLEVSACAPTGIAAARIRIQRTPVRAFTLHYLFGLNAALEGKFDPSKPQDERLLRLVKTQVLFTDEASMIDDATWLAVKDQLTTVGAVASATRGAGEMPPVASSGMSTISYAVTSSSSHQPRPGRHSLQVTLQSSQHLTSAS